MRDDYRKMTITTSINSVNSIVQRNITNEFELNDTGNAHRFVDKFGDIIRYNVDNQTWMLWNGKYWQNDVYNNIKNYAEIVVEDMKQQVLLMDDTPQKNKYYLILNVHYQVVAKLPC